MGKMFGFLSSGEKPPPLAVGDQAPQLVLLNQDGVEENLESYRGRPVVVYFYGKNNTSVCTKQACLLRDSFEDFTDGGAVVFGVSGDSVTSHKAFKDKYELPFTLLSDSEGVARKDWRITTGFFGIIQGRLTFVIDPAGAIRLVFNNQMDAEKHVVKAVSMIKELAEHAEGD